MITLGAGEDNPDIDAGIVPTPPALGSLGDTVFSDTDGDGVQDSGELGVSGVTVNLLDDMGTLIDTTTTDGSGFYEFTDLAADDYIVEFVAPTGSSFTVQDAGGDDAADSDANPATGRTDVITLGAGEDNPDIDAGVLTSSAANNSVTASPPALALTGRSSLSVAFVALAATVIGFALNLGSAGAQQPSPVTAPPGTSDQPVRSPSRRRIRASVSVVLIASAIRARRSR